MVKTSLGREASQEECDAYCEASEGGRKVMKDTLAEAAKRTEKVVKAAGLTEESLAEGQDPDRDPNKNPLVLAVRNLQAA